MPVNLDHYVMHVYFQLRTERGQPGDTDYYLSAKVPNRTIKPLLPSASIAQLPCITDEERAIDFCSAEHTCDIVNADATQ